MSDKLSKEKTLNHIIPFQCLSDVDYILCAL